VILFAVMRSFADIDDVIAEAASKRMRASHVVATLPVKVGSIGGVVDDCSTRIADTKDLQKGLDADGVLWNAPVEHNTTPHMGSCTCDKRSSSVL
jgi:hypothetical protein